MKSWIARVRDNYYASDNRCPHMGGNLSMRKLEGTVVMSSTTVNSTSQMGMLYVGQTGVVLIIFG